MFQRAGDEDGQPKARLNFSHVNPATGPIVVEGAEPGDVLRVHIRAIRPEKTGALMTAPALEPCRIG